MRPSPGDLIVFGGDSLTAHVVAVSDAMETQEADLPPVGTAAMVDRHEHRGWVELLQARVTTAFPERDLRFLNAGRGGDTSRLFLQRFEADVLDHRPTCCAIAVGVNDVRRNFQTGREAERVGVDEYRSNLFEMVGPLRSAGSAVALIEPTSHARPPTGAPPNVTVEEVNYMTLTYANAMRGVAAECSALFVPILHSMLRLEARLNARSPRQSLFADEVHLNTVGDTFYAQAMFEALTGWWATEMDSGEEAARL